MLDGIDLDLRAGRSAGRALGANGAGKTTLLAVSSPRANWRPAAALVIASTLLPLREWKASAALARAAVRGLLQSASLGFDLSVREVVAMGPIAFPS
ncbi:hypothetical protein ACTMU2_00870 [Cupriavidus basilensis]